MHLQKFSEGTERNAETRGVSARRFKRLAADSNGFESTAWLDGESQGAKVVATKQQRRFKGQFDATDTVLGRAGAACRAVINKSHQCHYCLVGRQFCIILS